MTTLNLQVGASSDDALQAQADTVNLTGTSLGVDHTDEHAGLRFTGVTIAQGSTIDDATLTVNIFSADWDEPKVRINAEDIDDAPTFTTTSDDIDGRIRTTASDDWDAADLGSGSDEWWEWGSPNGAPTSGHNLNSIIQEITDRGSWSSGNALVLIYQQPTLDTARDLAIRTYDYNTALAAKLDIDYTVAAAGQPTQHRTQGIPTGSGYRDRPGRWN